MSRLRHSSQGFVRLMQMSRHRVWVFVEGLLDRTFYDSICINNSYLQTNSYCVSLAQEVPEYEGNGKSALMSLYRSLRSRKKLTMSLGERKTTVLFFLDKDIDDKRRTLARSDHVLYTKFYTVENYLFRYGDLCEAVKITCMLDQSAVAAQIGLDALSWTREAAKNWKEWVGFCFFARKHGLHGVPNYGKTSKFQHGPYAPVDPTLQNTILSSAHANSGLPIHEFDQLLEASNNLVNKLYARDEFDTVFNGKWYLKFIIFDAQRAAGSRQYQRGDIEKRLTTALLGTLDFSADWADHFHEKINRVVQSIE